MLDKINIKDFYSSDEDDIVNGFYNQTLECAISYDRITGYFSPHIFAIAARGFAGLINNGGKIRILSSVQVDSETYNTIVESVSFDLSSILNETNFGTTSLQTELQKDYLRVFMYLYKIGALEMKVAIISGSGILHQKVGIIRDYIGNALSFSGSNNETVGGAVNNLEEFKVFKNWTISTSTYFSNDELKFEKYWNDSVKGIKVLEVSDAIKEKLIKIIDIPDDIKPIINRIKIDEMNIINDQKTAQKHGRSLREYQIDAITHWVDHDYNSIFEMATGTGKTFTAINALKEFYKNKTYLRAVVVVPLITLTIQWQEDIKKIIPDVVIINTSTNLNWKDALNNLVFSKELGRSVNYIIITTYSMFSKTDFGEKVTKLGSDNILLADEMHNLVNKTRIAALANSSYEYKLGLSATPTRLWQQAESAIARLHFGNNSYQYSLEDAIKNGYLVPYNYHPLTVHLTVDEYEDYLRLSREISRMSQINNQSGEENISLNMKLIARSRIKKNAENKIFLLEQTLLSQQRTGMLYDSLIYVDNKNFLQYIQEMLTRNNIRTTKFTGNNSLEERISAIENLRSHSINAIIAIKCLDEGVDIPSAKTAFFISNNTDPREYVQRLGRVLRLDEEGGKDCANIYDYIVVPPTGVLFDNEIDRRIARNMLKNELIRSKFFNQLAMNSEKSQNLIDNAVDSYGFYFEDDELVYNIGDEDNELTY